MVTLVGKQERKYRILLVRPGGEIRGKVNTHMGFCFLDLQGKYEGTHGVLQATPGRKHQETTHGQCSVGFTCKQT